jgi:hypothetical protein
MAVTPTPGLASSTPAIPGQPINALAINLTGGYISNPINAPAPLYVDPTGPASTTVNGTSMALAPGSTYYAIPVSTLPVSVASNVPNHNFVSVQWI